MALLRDAGIAVFAAIGVASVLFLLLRAVFAPRRQLYSPVYLVVPVEEKTRGLEQTVGELQLLCNQMGGGLQLLLVDCGMTAEQRKMAGILRREDPLIGLCESAELTKEIGG